MRRLIPVATALGLLLCASPALGATINVNTTTDTLGAGVCSLREAIDATNGVGPTGSCTPASGTANVIVLGATTYKLTLAGASENQNATGDLDINAPVTIAGAGPTATTIDGNRLDRVVGVNAGAGRVRLQDLAITDGHAPDGPNANAVTGGSGADVTAGNGGDATLGRGGGISNFADLALLRCRVFGNQAGRGGIGGGATAVMGSSGDGRSATGGDGGAGANGGGIVNLPGATLTVTDSVLATNFAGNGGGGGPATGGPGDAAGNATGGRGGAAGSGGAIDNESTAVLTVERTTMTGNRAGSGGTGGFALGGPGSVTFGGAGFGRAGGFGGDGGAVFGPGDLTIKASTIDSNHAGDAGTGGTGEGGSVAAGGHPGIAMGGDGGGHAGGGGGLHVSGGTLNDVTLSANAAGAGGNAGPAISQESAASGLGESGGDGGAVFATTLVIGFSTFAGNLTGAAGTPNPSAAAGTGSAINGGGGTVTLQQSVIASDTCANGVTSGANSIVPASSGCPGTVGNAQLGALLDNGGPTRTRALGAGSAAIDFVPSTAIFPAEDQRGAVRPGGTRADAGAYEVDPPSAQTGAGTAVAIASATLTGAVDARGLGTAYRFEYGRSTALGQSTPTARSASRAPAPVSAGLSGLAAGAAYFYRVVATGPDGTSTGQIRSFTTRKPSAPPPAGGSSPRDRTAPKLTKLHVTPKRFRAGAKAKITFQLSENAAVVLAVQQKGVGVKVKPKKGKARCVTASAKNKRTLLAQIKKKLGKKKAKGKAGHKRIAAAKKHARCAIYHSRGTLKKTGKTGANSVALPAKLAKKPLAAGTYRIVAGASDAARNKAKSATAGFSIVKKKAKKS